MPKKEKKSAKKSVKKDVKKESVKAPKKKAVTRKKSPQSRPAAAVTRVSSATPGRIVTRKRAGQTEIIGVIGSVTQGDIALKAYYIAERRRNLGLPGDPESDWLEAERQLRS